MIPLLCTIILTVNSVYADNNTYNSNKFLNTKSHVNHTKSTIDNSEQYELKITKDSNVTNTHVELLPDDNGKYWIPKGYKVKVSADCNDGYKQNTGTEIVTMSDTQTVDINCSVSPPQNPLIDSEGFYHGAYTCIKGDTDYNTNNPEKNVYLKLDGTTVALGHSAYMGYYYNVVSIKLANKVDVTNYSKVIFKYSFTGNYFSSTYCQLAKIVNDTGDTSNVSPYGGTGALDTLPINGSDLTYELPLSGYTGEKYIGLYFINWNHVQASTNYNYVLTLKSLQFIK